MTNQYHHADLRTELIKTGLHMIQQYGIENVSLRKLAKACGVSEAAPYSHFRCKEDLLAAIQEYVADELYNCIKHAYEDSPDVGTPRGILDIGKAYVLFFIEYPEYFTFLLSQPGVIFQLSMEEDSKSFLPFRYYKEKAYAVYQKLGFSENRIKYGIIAMWTKVHGIASIASMKGIERDFEWSDVLEQILVE